MFIRLFYFLVCYIYLYVYSYEGYESVRYIKKYRFIDVLNPLKNASGEKFRERSKNIEFFVLSIGLCMVTLRISSPLIALLGVGTMIFSLTSYGSHPSKILINIRSFT